MAAYRAGVRTVVIPAENEPDLADIDPVVRGALRFVTVERVDTVLDAALVDRPRKQAPPVAFSSAGRRAGAAAWKGEFTDPAIRRIGKGRHELSQRKI